MSEDSPNRIPIAIIGMSGMFPGSPTVADFWRHILAGTDLITDMPASHWLTEDYCNPRYRYTIPTPRGGFLPHVDFDPVLYGIPPRAAEQHRRGPAALPYDIQAPYGRFGFLFRQPGGP